MKHILSFTLLTLMLTACASPTPAPTATPTVSPSQTPQPTATHTPPPTATPGPFSELQQRLGSEYKLIKSEAGDCYEIAGVEGVKIYEDGTSDRTTQFEGQDVNLVIANQVIERGENGQLVWGVWEYRDG